MDSNSLMAVEEVWSTLKGRKGEEKGRIGLQLALDPNEPSFEDSLLLALILQWSVSHPFL
jgi:hypothetical protein